MKRFESAKDFHLRRLERKVRHAADAARRAELDRQMQEWRAAARERLRRSREWSQAKQVMLDSAAALLVNGVAVIQRNLEEPHWTLAPETLAFEAWKKQQGHR